MKKFLNSLLCATILAGLPSVGIVNAAGSNSELNIKTEATAMNVTVPGTSAMIFNEDGSNTYPDNFMISNKSAIAGIYLSSISMDAGSSGWKLADDTVDIKKQAVNKKTIRMKIGKDGVHKLVKPSTGSEATSGVAEYGVRDILIPASENQVLSFDVDRGAFSTNQGVSKAFSMTLNFEYAVGASYMTTGADFQTKITDMKATAKSLEFVNTLSTAPEEAIDVSSANDGSVKAYLDGTTLKIAFDGSLVFNPDSSGMFSGVNASEGIAGGEYVDSSKVVNASRMFEKFSTHYEQGDYALYKDALSFLNTSSVENASYMFAGYKAPLDISHFDLSKVSNASYMFSGFNGPLYINNNMDSVVDASYMFYKMSAPTFFTKLSLKSATNAEYMFSQATGPASNSSPFTSIKFSSALKNASHMFDGCVMGHSDNNKYKGVYYDLSKSGMDGVTDASYMFKGTYNSPLGYKLFNVTNLEIADYMFSNCGGSNTNVDLSNLEFTNLKSAVGMFDYNTSMGSIIMENTSFPQLLDATKMFNNTMGTAERHLVLSNLSFPKLTNASYMFYSSSQMYSEIDFASISFGSLEIADYMIAGFTNDCIVDLSNWDMSTLKSANNMFSSMYGVKSLGISNWNLSNLLSAENFLAEAPYLSDGITIRNPNTNIAFDYSYVSNHPYSEFVVNYVDDTTKAIAENIVSTAKTTNISSKFTLGEKVI